MNKKTDFNYKVFASFYKFEGKTKKYFTSCSTHRLFADVVENGFEETEVDAYILMINPGSCEPINKTFIPNYYSKDFFENYNVVEAKSDMAQKCVMKLMKKCDLKKVRILNLSDEICSKSEIFYENVKRDREKYMCESIFSQKRKNELCGLISEGTKPIFVCYGVNDIVRDLKEQALQSIKKLNMEDKIIGIAKEKDDNPVNYYYIKPRKPKDKEKIISDLSKKYEEYKINLKS